MGGLSKIYASDPQKASNGLIYGNVAVMSVFTFIMPICLGNIGWKMYMINASWDIITFGLIAYYWVETKGMTLGKG
ncbi:hypothetical protein N7462_005283 [Penicillium macrosclerotiorum]|uniref:uncharacterized protein n=1 Tax=Penicillium macrosclerotiorum TaxID=303699 RepID=UPI002548D11C|nr:uncharacterized protein N7462_005283 [Penicillium macrosclerotiorum]KAJ5690891.1 hypothetical protein N7462_005283 [Penicillium macrosclerotiorum]